MLNGDITVMLENVSEMCLHKTKNTTWTVDNANMNPLILSWQPHKPSKT